MALLIKNIRELIQVESKPKLKVSGPEMAKLLRMPGFILKATGSAISGR